MNVESTKVLLAGEGSGETSLAALRRVAQQRGPGALVAVGNRYLGAVGRLVLGSVSADVLRSTGGAVLVCRLREGDRSD